jgi:hypothetical protein
MSRGRLLRFLNRQLSLPVSTISRVMREAVEERRGHLGVAEDARPFVSGACLAAIVPSIATSAHSCDQHRLGLRPDAQRRRRAPLFQPGKGDAPASPPPSPRRNACLISTSEISGSRRSGRGWEPSSLSYRLEHLPDGLIRPFRMLVCLGRQDTHLCLLAAI